MLSLSMIHKHHNPKTKIYLIKLHIFTISPQKYMVKLGNGSTYLTHLIKHVKYIFFRVKIINLNLTHLIKQVNHVNPFN